MENPITRVAEHQRRTLDFMLDSLGLRHAHDEVVRRDRIAELEGTVTALRAENRALRAEVEELEHQLYPPIESRWGHAYFRSIQEVSGAV